MAKDGISQDEFTIAEHRIKTADGLHKLYVQEWGNPAGTPIVYLHGGPGYYCTDRNKAIFDPKTHRVIFLDQRGSGHSKPYGSLKENTTAKLVDDLELIRTKLKIEKWSVTGTSWGSTLALCYGVEHSSKINGLVIGGVFLGTQAEVDWLEKGEFRTFFPEIDESEVRKKYTPYQLAKLVTPTIKLDDRYRLPEQEDFDEAPIKIEQYYTENKCFLPDNYILQNAKKITMPVTIIQGRYDMMTPPKAAYTLDKKLPNSNLHWTIAGHSSSDRANYDVTKAIIAQIK